MEEEEKTIIAVARAHVIWECMRGDNEQDKRDGIQRIFTPYSLEKDLVRANYSGRKFVIKKIKFKPNGRPNNPGTALESSEGTRTRTKENMKSSGGTWI